MNKTYIETETPSGNVIFSISEGKYNNETVNTCEEIIGTRNTTCKALRFDQIYRSTGNDLFILTYSNITSYNNNNQNVVDSTEEDDNQNRLINNIVYEYPGSVLPKIDIDFKLSTSFISVSTKNENDVINLIDQKNKVQTDNISLLVENILEDYLNITLDSTNIKHNKTYRQTGLSILFKIECTNVPYVRMNVYWFGIGTSRMNRFDCEYLFEVDDLEDQVIRNEFALTNNIDTYSIYSQSGIVFRYSVTGKAAHFSYSELIAALSQLIVLFGFCTTVVTYIGYYLLPHDSRLYRKYLFYYLCV